MNIGQIPAKWARQTPQGTAIVDATTGRRVNWADFDSQVRRLANGLRGLGLAKGDRIGVLSRNSAEYAAVYFACGRTGLVAQPMNWRLSPPELKKIVDNGEPRAYVSGPDYHGTARELAGMVDSVEHWLQYGPDGDGSYERLVEGSSDDEPAGSAAIGGDDPLFILYTGGTTGESKGGAPHPHAAGGSTGCSTRPIAERIVPSATSTC